MSDTYLVTRNELATVADAIRDVCAIPTELVFPNGFSSAIKELGFRVVTPLSSTENVSVSSAVLSILNPNYRDELRARAERMTEYILIQSKSELPGMDFDLPIMIQGDFDSTQLLQYGGTQGKVVYTFAGGSAQAEISDSGNTVNITPAFLSDIEGKITAFIRKALGSDTLEITYSNPVHVLMVFNDTNK